MSLTYANEDEAACSLLRMGFVNRGLDLSLEMWTGSSISQQIIISAGHAYIPPTSEWLPRSLRTVDELLVSRKEPLLPRSGSSTGSTFHSPVHIKAYPRDTQTQCTLPDTCHSSLGKKGEDLQAYKT
jgi:hypothetical protein